MLVPEINVSFVHDYMNVFILFDKKLPSVAREAATDAVIELAELVEDRIKGTKGLTRWPRHPRNIKTRSLPGTPPARITTDLLKSVRIAREHAGRAGMNERKYFASVEVNSPYADIQEYGNARLQARPFMQPAYDWLMETEKADRLMARAADRISEAWSNG